MNQKQLQYFLMTYETQNIQQAADRLFISRQAVSKTIRELENELGAALFDRSSKGLSPTDFAKTLLPHVQNLLTEYNYIAGLHTLDKQKRNVITIYALDNMLQYLTADFLYDFHVCYPDIILTIQESTDDTSLQALLTQKADFAITTGPIDHTRFTAIPLFYTRYCLAISKQHPLAAKETIRYQDLHNQTIVSKGRSFSCYRNNMEKHILGKELHVDILAELTDISVALEIVKRNQAIYLGYDYIGVMHPSPSIVWKYLNEEPKGNQMYLVTLKDTLPRKVCRDFQRFLSTWIPLHHKDTITQ